MAKRDKLEELARFLMEKEVVEEDGDSRDLGMGLGGHRDIEVREAIDLAGDLLRTHDDEDLVPGSELAHDLPEGESEIIAGHLVEYSGFKYALFYLGEYLGMFAVSALGITLFLGGWQGPSFIPDEFWFLIKAYLVFVIIEWMRWSTPRVRVDQILNIGWKRLMPLAVLTC
jgi:hypothetical protein